MYVEQHVLSGGKTHYDRTVGAVLITVVLYLVQLGVYSVSPLYKQMHAVTYFPSLLLLAVITDYGPDANGVFSFGVWPWFSVLLLAVFILSVYIGRQLQTCASESNDGPFSRVMWINLLTMSVMFLLVGIVGNGNDVMRYRMKMETGMMRGDYDGALTIGAGSMANDSSLTMLRIYALARTGKIGDKLFSYPLTGGKDAMIPNGRGVRCFMYPEKKIVRFSKSNGAHDYRLCGYLMDKDLDAFVSEIAGSNDSISSSLPKHYREALILYTHIRSNPKVVYHDDVLDADYEDLQKMEKNTNDKIARESNVRDAYGKTYWYYYFYGKKKEK